MFVRGGLGIVGVYLLSSKDPAMIMWWGNVNMPGGACVYNVVVDGGQCYLWDIAHPCPSICRGKTAPGGDSGSRSLLCSVLFCKSLGHFPTRPAVRLAPKHKQIRALTLSFVTKGKARHDACPRVSAFPAIINAISIQPPE